MILNEYASKRQQMVDSQIIPRGIKNGAIINAMRKIPRHLFLDEALRSQAYEDCPSPIGEKQTISQPYIVALMTELLQLKGEEKILEIGTGSGYQAAVLAEVVDQVYSVERIPALAKRARKLLDELKYTNILITIDDGSLGWREYSPYDGIIVTAASPCVPKALLDQLNTGSRLVIPVGEEHSQDLIVYTKEGKDNYNKESYGGCRFVKLIGNQGWKS